MVSEVDLVTIAQALEEIEQPLFLLNVRLELHMEIINLDINCLLMTNLLVYLSLHRRLNH